MFLVDRQDGTIKARTCADGRKQWLNYSYNKHNYASPNCANNGVMITSALEAKECHDMAIIYISGAYRHTCMEKHGKQRNIMLFKGKLADLIIMVDLNLYRKYVSYDRNGNATRWLNVKDRMEITS